MLFGHQNDDTTNQSNDAAAATPNPLAVDPSTGASLPVPPAAPAEDTTSTTAFDTSAQPPAEPSAPPVAPAVDPADDLTVDELAVDEPTETSSLNQPAYTVSEPAAASPVADTPAATDLLDLKQQALSQLSPLVSQLDQTPEEKFRTTMMMIQSTDNQALLKDAYEAAQAITDEKVRAQALLDVVNEINYFTQPKN